MGAWVRVGGGAIVLLAGQTERAKARHGTRRGIPLAGSQGPNMLLLSGQGTQMVPSPMRIQTFERPARARRGAPPVAGQRRPPSSALCLDRLRSLFQYACDPTSRGC